MVTTKATNATTQRLREALGARITEERAKREWTQKDLAERTGGLDQGFISRIESGRTEPCLGTLAALAKAFDMSISELMKDI
jgi:transcriptional regulator with XRE-family HTH domain